MRLRKLFVAPGCESEQSLTLNAVAVRMDYLRIADVRLAAFSTAHPVIKLDGVLMDVTAAQGACDCRLYGSGQEGG